MSDLENGTTRRRVIGTAAGIVTVGALPGIVAGRKGKDENKGKDDEKGKGGPPSDAKNTCPEGTVLLAKYEVEGGEFVYEKDGDYLEVGDAFEFTVTETKDGGEIIAFDVEDPRDIYDFHTISVKTGAGVFREGDADRTSGSFDARDFDEDPPVQAVSNVILCAKVWWQVDFGRGDVPTPPYYRGAGRNEDFVLAATGDGTDESVTNPSGNADDEPRTDYVNALPDPDEKFEIDLDEGTATIEFDGNTDNERLHLASFETPGEFVRTFDDTTDNDIEELRAQDLFEVAYTSEEAGAMTVDIPTPEEYD